MIPAQELVERGLATAGASGAEGCAVLVEETSHADVRFALNTTTTNGTTKGRSVSVVVVAGPSVGMSRRSGVVGAAGVDEMVRAALADARQAPPAEDAYELVEPATPPVGRDFGLPPEEAGPWALDPVLTSLPAAVARAQARDAVLSGYAVLDVATVYLGTSTGVRLAHSQPTGAVHLVGRTEDGTGSAWVGAPTSAPVFEEMEDEIWRRLGWGRRTVDLDAGRYEVILPPSAVADLMAMVDFSALGLQDAEDGRSVFSAGGGRTRLGERITALPFTLSSDPAEPGAECIPFVATGASWSEVSVFDNGWPIGRVDWLHEGELANLRAHRAGAARSGVPMAPYGDNLVLRCDAPGSGAASVDEMVRRTGRGLLLTCLWYVREVDPATLLVTGLTRDGVYVVEDGAVVGAANNFRFNESPVDLLGRAIEVGTPVRTLGREFGEDLNRAIVPPLRIPDFNMSSVSQAS